MSATPQEILRTWTSLPVEISSRYELKGYLGHGSFGFVFLCTRIEDSKDIALKISRDAETIQAYKNEAKKLKKFHLWKQEHKKNCRKKEKSCKSPLHNLGQATFFKTANNTAAIDTKFVKNSTTLKAKCSANQLSMKQILSIFKQLIKVLRFLERKGMIHADVKPENILVTEKDKQVKLIDFGKVKKFPYRPFEILQSYNYLHPLSILFSDGIDSKIDIWSLGCVLFKMITESSLVTISLEQYFIKFLILVETLNGPMPREWLEKGRYTDLYYDIDPHGNYVLKPSIPKPNIDIQRARLHLIIEPMMAAAITRGLDQTIVRQLADLVISCVSYDPPTYSEMLRTIRSLQSYKSPMPSEKELQLILSQLPDLEPETGSPPPPPSPPEFLRSKGMTVKA